MSWPTIRGHEPQQAAFTTIMQRGKLAHAYLFVGPEGIGKKKFALELVRSLSCQRARLTSTLDACGLCPPCVQIAAGSYPDLDLLTLPEDRQEFPVELMHTFIRRIGVKPVYGHRRFAIMDNADRFNEESANALLKTLEEPPPLSLLILLSPSTTQLLPTIVSRCQVVRFGPLPVPVIAELLQEQGLATTPLQAEQIAALAQGSMSQALLLADAEVMQFQQDLMAALVAAKFSSVTWADRINKFVEEAGKESASKRLRASLVVQLILHALQAALRVSPQAANPSARGDGPAYLAQKMGAERLMETMDQCLEADWMIQRRVQLVLVLEALADRLGQALRAV